MGATAGCMKYYEKPMEQKHCHYFAKSRTVLLQHGEKTSAFQPDTHSLNTIIWCRRSLTDFMHDSVVRTQFLPTHNPFNEQQDSHYLISD